MHSTLIENEKGHYIPIARSVARSEQKKPMHSQTKATAPAFTASGSGRTGLISKHIRSLIRLGFLSKKSRAFSTEGNARYAEARKASALTTATSVGIQEVFSAQPVTKDSGSSVIIRSCCDLLRNISMVPKEPDIFEMTYEPVEDTDE